MIAKKVTKKKGTKSDFKNLVGYLMREHKPEESIEYNRISNCGFNTIDLATKEIQATQARNTRSKADKTYHLVVSFKAGEHPTQDQLEDIEDEICKSIGYAEHQRISVLHTDTDNVHIHIAINKIHPENHRSIEVLRDHYRLSDACNLLEERHGLGKDNRIQKPDQQSHQPGKAGDLEAHSGLGSFKGWIKENVSEINSVLERSTDWNDLHKQLASFDLVLRERGRGLVMSSKFEKAYTKASDLGKAFSKGQLESRFGLFEKPNDITVNVVKQYKKRPQQVKGPALALWKAYQADRQQVHSLKNSFLNQIKKEHALSIENLKSKKSSKKVEIFHDNVLSSRQKRDTYRVVLQGFRGDLAQAHLESRQKRKHIHQQHPSLTWQAWLINKASEGNLEALDTLRSSIRKSKKGAEQFAFLGPANEYQSTALQPKIRANGDLLYTLQSSTIRDTGDELRMTIHQKDDLVIAIKLARQKYGDHLHIEGDDAFKKAVVELCVQMAQPVTFQDSTLERRREVLEEIKQVHQDKTDLENWIADKNKASEKDSDRGKVKLFDTKDEGSAIYVGIETISATQSVALYHNPDITLVVPINKEQKLRLAQYQNNTKIVLNIHGQPHSERLKRGR